MRLVVSGAAIGTAVLALFAARVSAVPLMLDKTEAVGAARSDAGTGLCGSVVKFVNQPAPLYMISEAVALLDRPSGDPGIVGRVSRLFAKMNFSVGTGSEGDLRAPNFSDEYFPYFQDPGASPMGADDNNIALRLRGYLNVINPTSGQ